MLAVQYALIFQFIKNIQKAENSKGKEKFENEMMTLGAGDKQYTVSRNLVRLFADLEEDMDSEGFKNANHALSISRINFLLAIVQNLDYIRKNAKNNAKDMTINDPSPLHKQRIEEAVSKMNKAYEVKHAFIRAIRTRDNLLVIAHVYLYLEQKSAWEKKIDSMKSNAYKTANEIAELEEMYKCIKQEHELTCKNLAINVSDDVKKLLDEIKGFFRDEVTDQELTKMAKGTTQEEENRTQINGLKMNFRKFNLAI